MIDEEYEGDEDDNEEFCDGTKDCTCQRCEHLNTLNTWVKQNKSQTGE
jgi:hypothetical protein